jgi:hypothetical protein
MATIRIDSVKEDMEVSVDATNDSGMVIAPKGTVLTVKHIRAFRAWGIVEVQIKAVEVEEAPVLDWDEIDAETRNEISNAMDRLYSENDRSDPVVAELEKITTSTFVRRHSQQQTTWRTEKVN